MGILVAVLALPLVSPAGAAAQAGDDFPPIVSNVHVDPSSLSADGGLVTIFADATDDNGGVTGVQAEVTGPYGGPETVPMSFTNVGPTYSGSITIPANFTSDVVHYYVTVTAMDTGGNSATAGGADVTVDAAPPNVDERPVVSDPTIVPSALPSSGGASKIRVTATDDYGIAQADATVTRPDGTTTNVPLAYIGGMQYEGTFNAPANPRPTVARYAIDVTVLDGVGQSASTTAGALTVAPAPLNLADLKLKPGQLSFGNVKVGKQATQSLLVRNTGGKSTGPVSGVVSVAGAGFVLVGRTVLGPRVHPPSRRVQIVLRRVQAHERGEVRGHGEVRSQRRSPGGADGAPHGHREGVRSVARSRAGDVPIGRV